MASGLDDGVENFSARSTADIATGELRVTTVPRADDSPNNPKPASLDVTGVGWMASGLDDGVENFSARSTADIATD